MKAARIFLLFAMGFIVFCMVSCPGTYDSRDMVRAVRDYSRSPNEQTQKELVDARASVKRRIQKIELFFMVILVALGFGFVKAGRKKPV